MNRWSAGFVLSLVCSTLGCGTDQPESAPASSGSAAAATPAVSEGTGLRQNRSLYLELLKCSSNHSLAQPPKSGGSTAPENPGPWPLWASVNYRPRA